MSKLLQRTTTICNILPSTLHHYLSNWLKQALFWYCQWHFLYSPWLPLLIFRLKLMSFVLLYTTYYLRPCLEFYKEKGRKKEKIPYSCTIYVIKNKIYTQEFYFLQNLYSIFKLTFHWNYPFCCWNKFQVTHCLHHSFKPQFILGKEGCGLPLSTTGFLDMCGLPKKISLLSSSLIIMGFLCHISH